MKKRSIVPLIFLPTGILIVIAGFILSTQSNVNDRPESRETSQQTASTTVADATNTPDTPQEELDGATLTLEEEDFVLEVVDTPAERTRGLSGRIGLNDYDGMLFVFDESDLHGIWMRGMLFPIDIIWLDTSFQVVGVKKYAHPASFPSVFYPEQPARYVIEVPAGFAETHEIDIGQTISVSGI